MVFAFGQRTEVDEETAPLDPGHNGANPQPHGAGKVCLGRPGRPEGGPARTAALKIGSTRALDATHVAAKEILARSGPTTPTHPCMVFQPYTTVSDLGNWTVADVERRSPLAP
jgi:hypothetical protein